MVIHEFKMTYLILFPRAASDDSRSAKLRFSYLMSYGTGTPPVQTLVKKDEACQDMGVGGRSEVKRGFAFDHMTRLFPTKWRRSAAYI